MVQSKMISNLLGDCGRLELFFKTQVLLKENVIPFLQKHSIHKVNITNKAKEDQLLEQVRILHTALPNLAICCHYSLKQHPAKDADQHLKTFLKGLREVPNTTCLLVSGGKKPKFDTIQALNSLKQPTLHSVATSRPAKQQRTSSSNTPSTDAPPALSHTTSTATTTANHTAAASAASTWPAIHVAFNPYLPGNEQNVERQRLKLKLQSGMVAGVYLQVGSDLQLLEDGLTACHELMRQHCNTLLPVHGSVFVPSKRLLAQMRFRPWNGVFLSESYLSSVEEAICITKSMLEIYAKHDVIPLIETAIQNDADVAVLSDLLSHYNNARKPVQHDYAKENLEGHTTPSECGAVNGARHRVAQNVFLAVRSAD